MSRLPLRLATSLAGALLLTGCVTHARNEMTAARQRYAGCVAAASERECEPEKQRMLAAERAYQESARRAWGCDPAQPDCPPRR